MWRFSRSCNIVTPLPTGDGPFLPSSVCRVAPPPSRDRILGRRPAALRGDRGVRRVSAIESDRRAAVRSDGTRSPAPASINISYGNRFLYPILNVIGDIAIYTGAGCSRRIVGFCN